VTDTEKEDYVQEVLTTIGEGIRRGDLKMTDGILSSLDAIAQAVAVSIESNMEDKVAVEEEQCRSVWSLCELLDNETLARSPRTVRVLGQLRRAIELYFVKTRQSVEDFRVRPENANGVFSAAMFRALDDAEK
jgi:hypothetical protein